MAGGRSGSLRKDIHFEPARDQSTISVDRLARILANSLFISNHFFGNDSFKEVRDIYTIFLSCFNKVHELNFYMKERVNSYNFQFKYSVDYNFFPPLGVTQPIVGVYFTAFYRALASSRTRLLNHIQRRATFGRTPLNE